MSRTISVGRGNSAVVLVVRPETVREIRKHGGRTVANNRLAGKEPTERQVNLLAKRLEELASSELDLRKVHA